VYGYLDDLKRVESCIEQLPGIALLDHGERPSFRVWTALGNLVAESRPRQAVRIAAQPTPSGQYSHTGRLFDDVSV
jgi:hypothetical protein